VKVVFVKYPDECCPQGCARHARCCSEWLDGSLAGRAWWAFRCAMYRLIENKYFETFIILMILASSLSLVLLQLSSTPPPELLLNNNQNNNTVKLLV